MTPEQLATYRAVGEQKRRAGDMLPPTLTWEAWDSVWAKVDALTQRLDVYREAEPLKLQQAFERDTENARLAAELADYKAEFADAISGTKTELMERNSKLAADMAQLREALRILIEEDRGSTEHWSHAERVLAETAPNAEE